MISARFNFNDEENIISLLAVRRHYLTEDSKIATDHTQNLMNTGKQGLCSRRTTAIALWLGGGKVTGLGMML